MNSGQFLLDDEAATLAYGQRLATCLVAPCQVHLLGQLGAGKTTLVRGLLRAMGVRGTVKSPTYSLIESYDLAAFSVHHLDLYRLADPEELEYTGLLDLLSTPAIWLIEWPERGIGVLPQADLTLHLAYEGESRLLQWQSTSIDLDT